MSTIINSSDTASETRRTQGLKIISVILLTLFTGFYVNSWQRSLAEYAQKQQAETNVSSSTTTIRETSKVDDTQPVSTINRASEETVPVVTEVTMTVAETPTGAKITDANTLEKLTSVLYNLIDTNWRQYPTFSENLVYRVTMNSSENVAEYQHINKAASKYIKETPLAKLANLSTTAPEGASKSTAEFLVILTPDGVLQVDQWVAE
ncbi:MAG: hypothetical protein O4803_14540 [Trichodesmium sp. St15_bin1_1]|jgi:hypothetical protein|nr:hypothetical protein [Trichodesmium sp. St16_bin2-tuft]MDE5107047.1 hypothetical protein [Trichodesmium sp. St17_bin3_1_1]MDE5115393.1 hypothetical protein [Trichodesmium sp. St15_bin1_1]MDE5123351.1 hypothetical protein [Trichodesmium sp. St19_bin1]